jgi:long-subunit acyl-CoA synthetase (AMP-forming)
MASSFETIGDLDFAEGNKELALHSIFTISYTSGTSGNSKGVMLSNANFLSAITNIM